jgi:hypothetical protein
MAFKNRSILSIGIVSAVIAIGTLVLVRAALAQTPGFNVTTSPLPISLSTKPGTTVTTDLRIKNTGNLTQRIKVGLMKFSASGDTGQPALAERGVRDDYFNWVSFSPGVFNAPPGQWMNVKMTIAVPSNAALGYYYAVTFSPANPEKANLDQSHTNYIGSTATLVLLDVQSGSEKRAMHIASLSSDHHFYQYLPASFTVKLRNDGNIHVVPTGTVFISRGGKTVSKIGFNDAGGNVLPSSNRVFNFAWKDGFPVYKDVMEDDKPVFNKDGSPKRHLVWNFSQASRLRFGHYTAKLLAVYNDGQRDVPLQASVSFWVVPWIPILIFIVALVFIGVGLWSTSKNIWRKVNRKSKNVEKK